MPNVVRLVNGGSIQVRTGVIQGIGPQGPRGVQGNPGPQGEQGPIGETGPMGAILQRAGKTDVANNNPIAANTDTVVSFGSVPYDNLISVGGVFALSQATLTEAGDYLLAVWLRFDDAAASAREVWFQTGGVTIARTSRMAGAGAPFYVDLTFPYRLPDAAPPAVINVLVRSGAATAIGAGGGSWSIVRTGSEPKGDIGPAGPVGPVGATGATGATGPSGTASSGFTKYSDLLPH